MARNSLVACYDSFSRSASVFVTFFEASRTFRFATVASDSDKNRFESPLLKATLERLFSNFAELIWSSVKRFWA